MDRDLVDELDKLRLTAIEEGDNETAAMLAEWVLTLIFGERIEEAK